MSLRRYQKSLTEELTKLHEREPQSKLTSNRYRAIRVALIKSYPTLINGTEKEVMLNFLRDVTYLDRVQRRLTEGLEREVKEELSQEFQMEYLSAEMGLEQNIQNLKKILNEKTLVETENKWLVFNKEEWLENPIIKWTKEEIDSADEKGFIGTKSGVDCYLARRLKTTYEQ